MTHYETLGLTRSAGQEEVAEAFRKLAMEYHPDRNGGDDGITVNLRHSHRFDESSSLGLFAAKIRDGNVDGAIKCAPIGFRAGDPMGRSERQPD